MVAADFLNEAFVKSIASPAFADAVAAFGLSKEAKKIKERLGPL